MKRRNTQTRQFVTLFRSTDGGLKYRGQVLNDLYDGWGEAQYRNGSRYTGYWSGGNRHGYGEANVMSSCDNITSTKPIKNCNIIESNDSPVGATILPMGTRIAKILQREKYAGEWSNGVKNGFGISETTLFAVYEADDLFVLDEPILKEISSIDYEGCWKDGYYDGWGRLNKSNGFYYEGAWDKGLKHGQGMLIYPNGDCYEGKWLADERQGQGKYCLKKENEQDKSSNSDESGSKSGDNCDNCKTKNKLIIGSWKADVMTNGVIVANNNNINKNSNTKKSEKIKNQT